MRLALSLTIHLPLPLVLTSAVAMGQWSPDDTVNFSVADGSGGQVQPKIAPTADGGCFISWLDGGAGFDVRVQRLDAAGNELFPHQGVLVADRGFSSTQDYGLDTDANGNALLTYRFDPGTGTQIAAALVTPAGDLPWGSGGVVLTSSNSFFANPKITGSSDGGSFVAWKENDDVHVQRLDAAGVEQWASDVTLAPPGGQYTTSDLHATGTDAVLSIVHQTGGFSSPKRLVAQKLDTAGAPLWGAAPVSVFSAGSLQIGNFPPFVPDGSGGAVFSWYDTSTFQFQCYAQRILSDGTVAFPQNGQAVSTNVVNTRVSPSVDFDPVQGATFVFWREQNAGMNGVSGQRFDASGNRQWGDSGVTVVALAAAEIGLVRARVGQGGASVFWDSAPSFATDRLFGAHLDASGAVDVPVFDVSSTPSAKSRLATATSTTGYSILAWQDERNDSGDLLAQNVNDDGSLGGLGTAYCSPAVPNSSGFAAEITAHGSSDVATNLVTLTATSLPPGQFGYFLAGQTQGLSNPPGSQGPICLSGNIGRFNQVPQIIQGPNGSLRIDLFAIPVNPPQAVQPGDTWNFQCWYRDNQPGATSNFTDAVSLTF
ncbi:MAG: hypothetical protein GY711_30455 [bacterium]|nr:hypothetical protein [bacterium]